MPIDTIKTKVREFLGRTIRNHTVQDDEDIFAAGFVNSLFAMQLVLFVEREFAFAVSDEDLVLDNFRTINALSGLVARRMPTTATA